MAIVTLAEQKAFVRVDFEDDDAMITQQIDAAQAHLEQLLGFTIETEFADPLVVPADLVGAVMQLAAQRYEYREAVQDNAVAETPLGVWDVVRQRRNYSF
ncbi:MULTISPECIES: head-tail connector protein [unclassified Mesorhizobium]|uniref:head-tail connector protein n=1 Tax=unclassified Mesorhizobium TaxID=325217 RepID=UPI001092EA76|nr:MULTISPECIES: head-tail connector protein [unclassified Mesorhizobium]TGP88930.1 phage gp6-like head-tail connector protein [Mesorhizobium sp. M8A.F.Ca.ET.218.01.1.1]TGT16090.1 phage gp6-like head-tail connector protein [Mesorhizobium sp. M8A.F.Ca.ET.213.01.1.1]